MLIESGGYMKFKTYDLDKLSETKLFDLDVVSRFFHTKQKYFDALTDFEKFYKRDLSNYNPTFVTHCDSNREELIKECFEVRAALVRLGMNDLLDALNVLENAAITKHEKEFSDGQVKFRATVKIYKEAIKNSEM